MRSTVVIGALALLFVVVPIARAAASAGAPAAADPTTGTISGTVTSTNGVPIPGVVVTGAYSNAVPVPVTTVTGGTTGGTTVLNPIVPVTATTDLRGRYTIKAVVPGQHYIYFRPPAGAPFAEQPYSGGAPPPASNVAVVVLAGKDTVGIDGALSAGGTISGAITTMAGAALPSVSACAEPQGSGTYFSQCLAADASGRYSFTNLPSGAYKVVFQNQSSQPPQFPTQYFDNTTNFNNAAVLHLADGQVLAGVNARMSLSCSVFGSTCTTVTNANGCVTGTYTAPLTVKLTSCSAATSLQWTDTAGHSVVGNPITLNYASSGPFTVTASANTGSSIFKDTIVVQFPATTVVPGPPSLPAATPRDGAVLVSWAAPASDGDAPITGYTVSSTVGNKTCAWTSGPLSCTVTGLTNGVASGFSVKATNAVGTGAASAVVTATPVTTPTPPATVTAFAGDTNALVTWSASPAAGGSPLTGYVAIASPGGQTCAAAVGRACSIDGLANGVPTTFTVRGVNALGVGVASTASAAVTPLGLPSAPLAVVGHPGDGQVVVAWTAPANNGGSAISAYKVTTVPGGATCSTAGALTCTVTGLTNAVPYTFTVVATNAAGASPVSAASAPVIPGTPSEPLSVAAVPGKQLATVSWTAPASSGSSPVAGYTVISSPYGAGCASAQLSCVVNGLQDGTPYTFQVYAQNALGVGPASAASNSVTPWSGSGYHPVVPSRILDSRTNTGWSGPVAAGTSRALKVTDLGGTSSVPSTASAVVMNVTATGATLGSFLTVWPSGSPQPTASNLNFAAGETIPNLVTVKIGSFGNVQFANAVGQVGVIGDVVGYYDDGTGPGDLYTPIDPVRMLDSRTATGGWNAKLTAGAPRDLAVRQPQNVTGVPATATAVIANVTVTGASTGSFLSVWPSGVAKPAASNLNFGAGQTISNLAIVQIGTNGALSFDNALGAVDVLVDVVGYYDPSAGSRFHAIVPTRFLDSRVGNGTYGPWGPGEQRTLYVGYGSAALPLTATGLVANFTATAGTAGSYITVFPGNTARPITSNINFGAGQTIPNLVAVKFGGSTTITIYNNQGTVNLIGDAVGYFALS